MASSSPRSLNDGLCPKSRLYTISSFRTFNNLERLDRLRNTVFHCRVQDPPRSPALLAPAEQNCTRRAERLAQTHLNRYGLCTSALKFWSTDPKSLIKEGSGYWQYIPTARGVRFLTWLRLSDTLWCSGPADRSIDVSAIDRLGDRPDSRPASSLDRSRTSAVKYSRMALINALARLGIAFA
jgi:hypothetical protein